MTIYPPYLHGGQIIGGKGGGRRRMNEGGAS